MWLCFEYKGLIPKAILVRSDAEQRFVIDSEFMCGLLI